MPQILLGARGDQHGHRASSPGGWTGIVLAMHGAIFEVTVFGDLRMLTKGVDPLKFI